MYPCSIHAVFPNLAGFINTAKLKHQESVEVVEALLGPLDTSGHHWWREACLVNLSGIANNGEVDVRDLVNVQVQISFEYTLPVNGSKVDVFWFG